MFLSHSAQYHAMAQPERLAAEWGLWDREPGSAETEPIKYRVAVLWRTHAHVGMGMFASETGVRFGDYVEVSARRSGASESRGVERERNAGERKGWEVREGRREGGRWGRDGREKRV